MAKIDRPARLIAYDTDLNVRRRQHGEPAGHKLVRARTILYAAIMPPSAASCFLRWPRGTRPASASSTIAIRCSSR